MSELEAARDAYLKSHHPQTSYGAQDVRKPEEREGAPDPIQSIVVENEGYNEKT